MSALQRRGSRFLKGKKRVPQQRTVSEYPPRRAWRLALQRLGEGSGELLVGQRMAWIDCRRIDGAHAPFLEVATRKGHGSDPAARICCANSTFARRRFAAVDLPCAPPLPRSGERATGLRGLGGLCRLARFIPGPRTASALRTTALPRADDRRRRQSPQAATRAAGRWPQRRSGWRPPESRAATRACSRPDRPSG